MAESGSSFGQIAPTTPRVIGINYIAVPKQGSPIDCPVISQQPLDVTVDEGDNAVFSVTATTEALPIRYQWQVSQDGSTWNDIANGSSYGDVTTRSMTVIAAPAGSDGYRFRVVATSDDCSESSDPGTLTVD